MSLNIIYISYFLYYYNNFFSKNLNFSKYINKAIIMIINYNKNKFNLLLIN